MEQLVTAPTTQGMQIMFRNCIQIFFVYNSLYNFLHTFIHNKKSLWRNQSNVNRNQAVLHSTINNFHVPNNEVCYIINTHKSLLAHYQN